MTLSISTPVVTEDDRVASVCVSEMSRSNAIQRQILVDIRTKGISATGK